MPDNEFGYGTVAPAVSAKGNLLNPSAPIASVAMPKVIAPVAPPSNAAPSSVQMPNVSQPQISQQQIQQMGDNTTGAVSNMVGNAMPGIIGTGAALLAGYGLSKIPSMLGKGKEEGKAPPESKQGIPAEVEKTQKVEEPKKENKYHLEQDHKELTKEELNKANEVFNTLDNIKTEPTIPKPQTPAQQTIKTELKPVQTNNPTSPIATTEPNPVVSGEGTSPLHNPAGQGLTQVEATSASATPNAAFPAETNTTKESGNLTNSAENPTQGGVEQVKKEVKGSVKPRAPRGSKIAELEASGLTKPELSMKKYLTSFYGGGEHGEDAYKKVTEILGKTPAYPVDEKGKMTGGGLTKDENDLIKIFRKENIEGPKINLTKSMKDQLSEIKKAGGSKTVKGAALLSALVALPEFVNAKNAYETSQAKQNLGESLLPIGATPTPVESGKLTNKQLEQYKEYGKLGSPYRQAFLQQTGGK